MKIIKVGTRQSQLALTQTRQVIDALSAYHPEISFELIPYQTTGDKLLHVSLQEIGGKGVFVKDIEQALVDGHIDMAVHSLKDVPALLAAGCCIGAVPKRQDVRDCLIFHQEGMTLQSLPKGAVVGTSSMRREVQLQNLRPDLVFEPLRGNIDTRIQKVQKGQYDAIVLAMAGLNRMGWTAEERGLFLEPLAIEDCLPAISQGALGIECRVGDSDLLAVLSSIHDEETAACVGLEREVLGLMNADCTFPIAAKGTWTGKDYRLQAMLSDKENRCIRVQAVGGLTDDLPKQVVNALKEQGAIGMR